MFLYVYIFGRVSECVPVVYTSVCVCVCLFFKRMLPVCSSCLLCLCSCYLCVDVCVLRHFAARGYVGACVYTHVHFVK